MPKFVVANYYAASINHEIEAANEAEAIEKAKEIPYSKEEIWDSLQYDESVIVERG